MFDLVRLVLTGKEELCLLVGLQLEVSTPHIIYALLGGFIVLVRLHCLWRTNHGALT